MLTVSVPEGTATTTLAGLLYPYSGGLSFAVGTRAQAASRGRMARLTVMSRTWDRLRGQG